MSPYYEDSLVRLYHGCAEEVLPQIGPMDVTLTDPPYNVGKNYGKRGSDRMEPAAYKAWLRDVFALCDSPELVFFPGTVNVFDVREVLPEGVRPYRTLAWHKREYAGDKWNGGPAMCWEPIIWATRSEKPTFNTIYGAMGRDFLIVPATHGDPFKGPGRHPNPKSLPVMAWLTGLFAPVGASVLDLFAGTGTTLYAARALGRTAIGIEREERFCALAAERLAQQVLVAA